MLFRAKRFSGFNLLILAASALGVILGVLLIQQNQDIRERAAGFTGGPVLYFVPAEITVPIQSTNRVYELYLDTKGYEVNGAVFELKFDTNVIRIKDVVVGDIMRLVNDHYVEGGTAYLSIAIAEQEKPFVGVGRIASVVFDTFSTPTTTYFTFEPNTQIHTKGLSGNTLDKAINGIIHIAIVPSVTPEATPTSVLPSPVPTLDPNAFCNDSDGHYNIFVKGTVTSDRGNFVDYCQDPTNLVEYYCTTDPNPRDTDDVQDCSWVNSVCFDGACVDPVSLTPTVQPTTTPIPTPCNKPGDANGDCLVNGLDFVIWLQHFATFTQNGPQEGDFNNDGFVDGLDYAIWYIYS